MHSAFHSLHLSPSYNWRQVILTGQRFEKEQKKNKKKIKFFTKVQAQESHTQTLTISKLDTFKKRAPDS